MMATPTPRTSTSTSTSTSAVYPGSTAPTTRSSRSFSRIILDRLGARPKLSFSFRSNLHSGATSPSASAARYRTGYPPSFSRKLDCTTFILREEALHTTTCSVYHPPPPSKTRTRTRTRLALIQRIPESSSDDDDDEGDKEYDERRRSWISYLQSMGYARTARDMAVVAGALVVCPTEIVIETSVCVTRRTDFCLDLGVAEEG